MEHFDLLDTVQPETGWFAITGLKGSTGKKNVRQELVSSRAAAERVIAQYMSEERDVYFGVAKFKDDSSRMKPNVLALRSFWVDLDCGASKAVVNPKTGRPQGYTDQAAALAALRDFCKETLLPRPIIVNSGRGIHAYWALEEDIPPHVWEPAAAKLRLLCDKLGLWVDPVVFETARVLRVPGTLNFKEDPPLEVEVLSASPAMSFARFCELVGVDEEEVRAAEPPRKRELTALAKSLAANKVASFRKIMARSAAGDGCAQLLNAYVERATISEPQWFDALSVAHFCGDRDKAIHKLSDGHPDYDPAVTEEKTQHIVGPHTCNVFEQNNPGGCDDCPFKGKIKSPIVLGYEIAEATEEDNIVIDDTTDTTYTIPSYPFPFFRGKTGGIYMKPLEEEAEPVLVYENDLYVVKRMTDPLNGGVVLMRCHFPRDGVKEFVIPNTKISEKSELRTALAWHDIMVKGEKQFALLAHFIQCSLEVLRHERNAELMRTQFGFCDNDSKFIIGDREISSDGTYHSPPSAATAAIAEHMVPRGTLEKWKEVFALYGRPGLEPHAFAALTAFGAPLLRFLGQKGMMINVIHPSSGTGKTTILHMCNSVYGSPDRLCAVKEDTLNSKVMRLGIYNNLPFTVDEITNTTAADFSTLIYNMSQGRGKDRVKASANEMRLNLTSWQTISLCSSNASFYEKLTSAKSSPDGESMRLIEYKIEPNNVIDTAHAKHMFDHQLMNNYGYAGDIYAGWLVNNLEEARDAALSIQTKLDRELRLTQRERIWSAGVSANIAGGLIAKRLGLIDWDMKAIYAFACTLLNETRLDVKPPAADAASVLGDYINRHMQNVLVVNDGVDRRSKMQSFPTLEPRGELLVRFEPDTNKMYIVARHFKSDCVEMQNNYKQTLEQLHRDGIYMETANKRISKGTKIASPAVPCLVFDCTTTQFIDVADLADNDQSADRGS
jgi:hypothetical protein